MARFVFTIPDGSQAAVVAYLAARDISAPDLTDDVTAPAGYTKLAVETPYSMMDTAKIIAHAIDSWYYQEGDAPDAQ